MRRNKIRDIWKKDGTVINGWLGIPDSFAAEVMAQQGWDSLTIDTQHGLADHGDSIAMLQAISTTDTVPLARAAWLDEAWIMRLLDAGCYGIICPMINDGAQAERFVTSCRYPPGGRRSFGPIRASLYGGADYASKANEEIVTLAMVETSGALDHIDDIMTTPGLDGVYVGPADLANSLGATPQFDPDDPVVTEAIEMIVKKSIEHKIKAGIHTGSPAYAKKMIGLGYRFVTILSDARLLAMGATSTLAAMREGVVARGSDTY
ncbi:MAG: aldolase/citrate lyase family protein [Pseudomonadota bacterium]